MKIMTALLFLMSAVYVSAAEVDVDPEDIILPGRGKIVIATMVSDASLSNVHEAAKILHETSYLTVEVRKIEDFSLINASNGVKTFHSNGVVYVIDDDNLPAELVAVMDRWAMANIAKLRCDNPVEEVLSKRIRCMTMRQVGFLAGATIPRSSTSLMCGAVSNKEIDAIEMESLSLDLLFNISRFEQKTGFGPGHKTSYRSACERGIAPAPRNEVQKRIWDEFHSIPTKPIKIKYDAKLGR